MSESLTHLQKLKGRLSTQLKSDEMSTTRVDKVDKLEQALSVFRTEVDMKLRIMQQILTTRNEQVTVQKKLLDKEQKLYNTLLVHWSNAPQLAATGLSINFSATDVNSEIHSKDIEHEIENDEQQDMEQVEDPDYSEGDDIGVSPSPKKSRSSLRRQRKSVRINRSSRNANWKSEETMVDQACDGEDWQNIEGHRNPQNEIEIGTMQYESVGGGEDFSELIGVGSNGDGEDYEDNETSEFPGSDMIHSSQNVKKLGSFVTPDGRTLELKLPQRLIHKLHAAEKERTMVGTILKHFYSVEFLRNCSMTGATNQKKVVGNEKTKQESLHPDMILLIQEAVKKFMPPTKSPNSEEGRISLLEQKQRVRCCITRVIQYHKDLYKVHSSKKSKNTPGSSNRKISPDRERDVSNETQMDEDTNTS